MAMSFTPPADVRSNAKRGLELRAEHNRGGTAVGVARARDLSNGASISLDTIKRMNSYFSRHEVDKKGEGWGKDSAGYIAWLLWGGDAGWSWAKGILRDNEKKDKATMAEYSSSYAHIVKTNKNDDGTLTVYGKATDSSIDIDQQICDENWLKEAMPQWMVSGGNIREQHSSIAAGVATEYEQKADGHYITALVVDPVSVKKVETGVLKGFSIGIRGPRVVRDTKAAGGRIIDGQIVEISLVDRPANPNAKLMLAKATDAGELEAVKQITIPSPAVVAELNKFDPDQERDENGRFSSGGGGSAESSNTSTGSSAHHTEARNIISNLEGQLASTSLDKETEREAKAFLAGARERLDQSEKFKAEGNTKGAVLTMNQASERVLRAEQLINGKSEFGTLASGDRVIYGNDQRGTEGSPNAEAMARLASSYAESEKSTDADLVKFDPDQERDENGRFSSGGGGSDDRDSNANFKAQSDALRAIRVGNDHAQRSATDISRRLEVNATQLREARATVTDPDKVAKLDEVATHLSNAKDELHAAEYARANGNYTEARNTMGDLKSSTNSAERAFRTATDGASLNGLALVGIKDMVETYQSATRIAGDGQKQLDYLNRGKSATSDSKVEDMETINKFDPDQERDENGRFGSGGGGSDKPDNGGSGDKDYVDDDLSAVSNAIDDAVDEIGYVLDDLDEEADEYAYGVAEQVSSFLGDATDNIADGKIDDAKEALDNALANATEGQDIAGMGTVIEMIEEAKDRLNDSGNKSIDAELLKSKKEARMSRRYDRLKTAVGSLIKFDQKQYDAATKALANLIIVEAGEMKSGHNEVESIKHLLEAIEHLRYWFEGEVAEGEVPGPTSLAPEVIELSVNKDAGSCEHDCEACGNGEGCEDLMCKCDSEKSVAIDVDDVVIDRIIDKAVASAKASVVEEIDTLKTALEAEREKAIQLEAELETAKKAVAPTGPKRSTGAVADNTALLQKAAEYNLKARSTTDPLLAQGYRELAKDLIESSRKEGQ